VCVYVSCFLCIVCRQTCVARAWDFSRPFIVAPAMNTMMWDHPLTLRHLTTLRSLGIAVIDPVIKTLACGDTGSGALALAATIAAAVRDALAGGSDLGSKPGSGPGSGLGSGISSGPGSVPGSGPGSGLGSGSGSGSSGAGDSPGADSPAVPAA